MAETLRKKETIVLDGFDEEIDDMTIVEAREYINSVLDKLENTIRENGGYLSTAKFRTTFTSTFLEYERDLTEKEIASLLEKRRIERERKIRRLEEKLAKLKSQEC